MGLKKLGHIATYIVPLPPSQEQHRIVAEVDRRLCVALRASVDANLARWARLRQAVLKRAFEGRLVPGEAEVDARLLPADLGPPAYYGVAP